MKLSGPHLGDNYDARLDSIWLRNAIRTGVTVVLCVLIVWQLGLAHGPWAVLAALANIRGTFSVGTSARSVFAITDGAACGVLIAGLLLLLQPTDIVLVTLLPIVALLTKLLTNSGPLPAQLVHAPFALVTL